MRKVSTLMGVLGLLTFAAACSDVEGSCGPGQVRDTDGLCKLPCELPDTNCDDGNDCTTDGCNNLPDLTAECTNVTKADDTNCTIDGLSGWCVSGQCDLCVMVNCDDGNDCTTDGKCNDVNGQCEGGTNEDLDTKCDHDGGSVCDGAGNCVECNNASHCAEDENQCTAASCESNQCGQSPVTDGNSCEFGLLPGICQAGVCVDAKLCAGKDCSDGLECTEDLCDPETGICSNPDEPDNTECDGGRGTCQSGVCVNKCEGKDCDDGKDCTDDGECDEFTGECPPKINVKVDELCNGGFCNGQGACVQCNDPNQCPYNECQDPTCDEANMCGTSPREDLIKCDGDKSVCLNGHCGKVLPCTDAGIRKAFEIGGGPWGLDCPDDAVIETIAVLTIDKDVVLDGDYVTLDATFRDRVITVEEPEVEASLQRLTMTHGFSSTGGCVFNNGTLELVTVNVIECSAWEGGGIYNSGGAHNGGMLTLYGSNVSQNTATERGGGGIMNVGTLNLHDSGIVENKAVSDTLNIGGGIDNDFTLSTETKMTVTGTTFAGNLVVDEAGNYAGTGGAIFMAPFSEGELVNSTVWGSAAEDGGAIFVSGLANLTLTATTVYRNDSGLSNRHITVGDGGFLAVHGTVIGGSCSLDPGATMNATLSVESPQDTCGFAPPNNFTPVSDTVLGLGNLAPNGWPVWTCLPESGSFLLNKILPSDCFVAKDARQKDRPYGSGCDIGAVERSASD